MTASMFAFGITSPEALEQIIHDILLNTEALGSNLGVTTANVNISPHAASIRHAWHESWALCHETSSNQQCSPSDWSWSEILPPRLTLETQNELRSAFRANYPGELLDTNSTPGQRYWAQIYHSNLKTASRARHGHKSSARESTRSSWRRKTDVPAPAWNSFLKCAGKKLHKSMKPSQILQFWSNAFALCGGCHSSSHKTFDAKLLACYTQQDTPDSGLRYPNLYELMAADRYLMGKLPTRQ